MVRKPKSLKQLLLFYELTFILLIVLAGLAGGVGIVYWQQAAQESLRINQLIEEIQQTRGDLYRQMKELFDAFFLADEHAHNEYDVYTRSVEQHFHQLRTLAVGVEETRAIANLQRGYDDFLKETGDLLQKRGKMRGAVLRKALNTDLESGVFSRYEALSASAERLLTLKRQESQRKIEQSTRIIIVLMVIPIFLASLLLVFSRIFLKRAIARPLAGILRATAEISAGHLHYRAPTASGTAELATLAGAINQMADELSRSQEALVRSEKQAAQGALVPMLAHNIRNPLASIRATAQMADEPDLPQETRQALTDIMGAVDRLERWTGAMLAYLHPLKPQLAEASLQEIIRGALAPLQQKLREKRLTLEWTPGEPIDLVAVDEHLLEQALYNLLLNAADAAPPGSAIAIAIACQRDATGVVLRILDRGPGMPFTPESGSLHPAPSSKRFGTGLGIPFAFKVCEALGGNLTFKPRRGGGTEVRLALPDSPRSVLPARL